MSSQTRTRTKSKNTKLTTWGYIWRLAVSIMIPLAVGGLSALITGDAMSAFGNLRQPPLAPPAWLFPVARAILYVLMGGSLFLGSDPCDRSSSNREGKDDILRNLRDSAGF